MSSSPEALPGEPVAGGETAQTHHPNPAAPDLAVERRCLERIINGGDDWREFFRLFHGFFMAVARQQGQLAPEELEDLWSAFIEELLDHDCKMLKRHHEEFPGHSFKSILWCHIKQLIAHYEKKRRAAACFDDAYLDGLSAAPASSGFGNPAASYEHRRMLRDAVVHAVRKARDRRRVGQILSLRFISTVSNKEIAEQFGMSENLVADIVRRYGPLVRDYLDGGRSAGASRSL
jgi:hypothetical protein